MENCRISRRIGRIRRNVRVSLDCNSFVCQHIIYCKSKQMEICHKISPAILCLASEA